MGFYFRKSMNLGPFRVNLSRGGVGWSVGAPGLRVGQTPRKRRYTTLSVPGTGLGYRNSKGCVLVFLFGLVGALLVLVAARSTGVLL